ncbi:MAG: hypothetical protein KME43_07575 [Myxacorys chilensis ATA2-1-KO14]|jgi:hypothetical protein|nr:hypothetical protein [Myxacorys chilensis ATA2-1-KO14]
MVQTFAGTLRICRHCQQFFILFVLGQKTQTIKLARLKAGNRTDDRGIAAVA